MAECLPDRALCSDIQSCWVPTFNVVVKKTLKKRCECKPFTVSDFLAHTVESMPAITKSYTALITSVWSEGARFSLLLLPQLCLHEHKCCSQSAPTSSTFPTIG